MEDPPFKTGDTVRLKNGKSCIRVMEVDYFLCADAKTTPPRMKSYSRPRKGWYIQFKYQSSMFYPEERGKWRRAEDFVLLTQEKEEPMATLYQTKEETPRFGTYLTKARGGKIVLEMKGKDGEVEAFDPKDIEEVMPYTVMLRKFTGGQSADRSETRHYEVQEGLLEKGDILVHLSNGNLWEVTQLDSKQKHPSESMNGFFKLEGKRITPVNPD